MGEAKRKEADRALTREEEIVAKKEAFDKNPDVFVNINDYALLVKLLKDDTGKILSAQVMTCANSTVDISYLMVQINRALDMRDMALQSAAGQKSRIVKPGMGGLFRK